MRIDPADPGDTVRSNEPDNSAKSHPSINKYTFKSQVSSRNEYKYRNVSSFLRFRIEEADIVDSTDMVQTSGEHLVDLGTRQQLLKKYHLPSLLLYSPLFLSLYLPLDRILFMIIYFFFFFRLKRGTTLEGGKRKSKRQLEK